MLDIFPLIELGGAMISVSRKNDAVIFVCQDNENQVVYIQDLNAAAEQLTGYTKKDLAGKPIAFILPPAIREILHSYLEFESGGKDLAAVLGKTRKVHIIGHEGRLVPVNLKVFHTVSTANDLHFQLLLRDNSFGEKMESLKEALYGNNDIPDKGFFERCLKQVLASIADKKITANFALLSICDYPMLKGSLSDKSFVALLGEINNRYHTTSRLDDAIGYLGDGKIGLLIIDCAPENLIIVLERILTKITAQAITLPTGESLSITMDSHVTLVTKDKTMPELIASCESPV